MACVSHCGEQHDKLWKRSDIGELFAQVPLPYDVLINVPELDSSTQSAIESAKVRYAGPRLEDSAPAGSLESHFGRPATKSQITTAQKDSVPVNTKKYKLSSECAEGLV